MYKQPGSFPGPLSSQRFRVLAGKRNLHFRRHFWLGLQANAPVDLEWYQQTVRSNASLEAGLLQLLVPHTQCQGTGEKQSEITRTVPRRCWRYWRLTLPRGQCLPSHRILLGHQWIWPRHRLSADPVWCKSLRVFEPNFAPWNHFESSSQVAPAELLWSSPRKVSLVFVEPLDYMIWKFHL